MLPKEAIPALDMNPQFLQALEDIKKSRRHVLITDRVGTEKSTLRSLFRKNTAKKVGVLAPQAEILTKEQSPCRTNLKPPSIRS